MPDHAAAATDIPGRRPAWRGPLLGLLLALAAGQFLYRGLLRQDAVSGDLAVLYGAARVWHQGGDPYDYAQVGRELGRQGFAGQMPHARDLPIVYPPSVFVLLWPVAMLPWGLAKAGWLALNLLLLAWLVARLGRWTRLSSRGWALGLWILAALLLAPLHTALAKGQLSIAAAALAGLAALHPSRDEYGTPGGDWMRRGLLAGLAAVLKPQVGGVALLFLLLKGRWKALATALVLAMVLLNLGWGRLLRTESPWRESLARNVYDYAHDGVGDPTAANSVRHQLINLHYPLHALVDSRAAVHVLVFTAAGLALLAGWGLHRRTLRVARTVDPQAESPQADLLLLSLASVVVLLALPHRFYDAVLLLFPLAWALGQVSGASGGAAEARPARGPSNLARRGLRAAAWLALACGAVFVVPGAAVLARLIESHRLPAGLLDAPWWHFTVMAHEVWTLCLLAGVLLMGQWWSDPRSSRL